MTQKILEKYGRQVLGVGILLVSLIAALALVGQANSSVEMWGAKYTLGPGAVITANDLEIEKVSLGTQAPKYFSTKAKIVGTFVTKNLSQGELIPVSAVTNIANRTSLKEIPVGVSKSDMPSNLRIGDLVDLYSIPIKDPKALTHLVASKIRVVAVDTQSQNMSGVVNLLLSVDKEVLLEITDAIQMGRIVVVRNAL
jgi:putative ubiquitin-RnfH superfamily antitoxin RatB of RatAB toxin-antitoxin module